MSDTFSAFIFSSKLTMSHDNIENLTVKDFEQAARQHLNKMAFDYYSTGAIGEQLISLNESVFSRYRVRPRVLVDVSGRDMSTRILGKSVRTPIGVSPTAVQKLAHSDGECGNARAVGSFGSVFILSTFSTTGIEDVAAAAPETIKWLQVYAYRNRDITRSLVKRAEKAGFQAIVLTVDSPVLGIRHKNKISLPSHLNLGNFKGTEFEGMMETKKGSGEKVNAYMLFDDSLDWTIIQWLKSISSLPVIVKGVLTREDARIAVDMGVSGIIVSNHGGRQLDCSPASLEALPEVVDEVGDICEVYFDGGIRYGSDAFKAIALGARMVFVGRPAVWGLACDGENGVKRVLGILRDHLDTTMALAGCLTLEDVRSSGLVVNQSFYA